MIRRRCRGSVGNGSVQEELVEVGGDTQPGEQHFGSISMYIHIMNYLAHMHIPICLNTRSGEQLLLLGDISMYIHIMNYLAHMHIPMYLNIYIFV